MVKYILTEQGYNVLTAATPDEAVCLTTDYDTDIELLLTDVVMPGMNGKELANKLTSCYPNIKVIFYVRVYC